MRVSLSTIRPARLWGALWLLIGVTAALAPVAEAQSVSGKAYGAFVQSPLGTQQSAVAVLPTVTAGDGAIAPNTRMDLPGVGYVVLNEQLPTGDGVRSSGLTVNLIHVYLQSLTGGGCTVLGCVPGVLTTTGEVIVGSATSNATM